MTSPASIRSHPVHPMLIAFPIGLWIFSLVADLIYHSVSRDPFWKEVAFYAMAGGIIGALLAAVPGFIDYLSISNRSVKRIATAHMTLNLVVVVLFLFNLGVRYSAAPQGEVLGVLLSIIGIVCLAVSGWLGGSLVYVHGVAVESQPSREEQRPAA